MAWRGRATALQCRTIEDFRTYLHNLRFTSWRPSGMVLHNTAKPTLEQWWEGGTAPSTRMANLKNFYQNEMGWDAGPHAFVDGRSIWVMTDFNVKGVHSPSWNATRLGIEMVGDYDTESDEVGRGAEVMALTVALFGECHSLFGWEPSNTSIKLHKEDTATTHDCPGRNVIKAEFVNDVAQYMGDAGDDHSQPLDPIAGVVVGLTPGDTLNIRATPSTSAAIIGTAENGDSVLVVGEEVNAATRWLRLQFGTANGTGVALFGWVASRYVKIEGAAPPAEVWRTNITATVFATGADPQDSAYPPHAAIDGREPGIALPYKWRDGPRPMIQVQGPGGASIIKVVDVGPYNIHDPAYVLEGRRPMVETQFQNQTPAQNGMVPTSDAAIDLTPGAAELVGIVGKGKVRWRIVV